MLPVHSTAFTAGADALGLGGPAAPRTGAFSEWCGAIVCDVSVGAFGSEHGHGNRHFTGPIVHSVVG